MCASQHQDLARFAETEGEWLMSTHAFSEPVCNMCCTCVASQSANDQLGVPALIRIREAIVSWYMRHAGFAVVDMVKGAVATVKGEV